VSNAENQPTGHGPKGWLEKGSVCVVARSLRIAPDMLLTHASHPDPFEANSMPPTCDSMHQNAPPRNNVPHPSPFELGIEQNKPIFFDDFYCIY
jgi:hypothetical protein